MNQEDSIFGDWLFLFTGDISNGPTRNISTELPRTYDESVIKFEENLSLNIHERLSSLNIYTVETTDIHNYFSKLRNSNIEILSVNDIDDFDDCFPDTLDQCSRCQELLMWYVECNSHSKLCATCSALYCRCTEKIIGQSSVENCFCDVCEASMRDKLNSTWYTNRIDDIDLCETCLTTSEGRDIVDNNHPDMWKEFKTSGKTLVEGFGSILDWIPVLTDEGSNCVLINANPDSLYFKKLGLVHGEEELRYVTIDCDFDSLFHDLIKINRSLKDLNIVPSGFNTHLSIYFRRKCVFLHNDHIVTNGHCC